jgi:hypothetical protein
MGLKLPETMLVLPLLIDAFPHARVVHLTRHPVSSSLRRTHMTSRLNNPVGAGCSPAAYRYSNRDVGRIATDDPCMHNACSWNFQVTRIARYAQGTRPQSAISKSVRGRVYATVSSRRSRAVISRLRPGENKTSIPVDLSRAGGWDHGDPRVETIWALCGETAELLGYTRDLGLTRPAGRTNLDDSGFRRAERNSRSRGDYRICVHRRRSAREEVDITIDQYVFIPRIVVVPIICIASAG